MLLHWRWCIVDSAGGRYHANGDASTQRNHPTTSGNPARGCRHANHGPDTIASRDDSRQSTASNAHPIRPARPHPHSNQHITAVLATIAPSLTPTLTALPPATSTPIPTATRVVPTATSTNTPAPPTLTPTVSPATVTAVPVSPTPTSSPPPPTATRSSG